MDIEGIMNRAKEYVQLEEHERFRSDVLGAIHREDLDGLNDRFYQELTFGTAGMRGVIGGGTNRMNPLTVGMVTQGLGAYLSTYKKDALVVIAYDSRNFSPLFAQTAAAVLCGMGIRAVMFPRLAPVPMLSFAVRYLKADAGITITASHNPAEYNGYKVYWADGAQVTPPHDEGIVAEVSRVRSAKQPVISMDIEEAQAEGLFSWVGEEVDQAYYRMVRSQSLRPGLFDDPGDRMKVVYTSLHGSGHQPVQRVLSDLGASIITVAEQSVPDGNFPTVKNPNPEDPKAMALALEYAVKYHADIVLGTDPDADRLGIAVPVDAQKREYRLLTGNQIAVLLCDYLYEGRAERGAGKTGVTVKSIVTTDLVRAVTEHYGGCCTDVLTGFKYIAEVMQDLEESDSEEFVLGAEESYGFLVETDVRDKDAVSAACMAVEMTKYHLGRGISLLERLQQIWEAFGYYEEQVLSRTLPGQKGKQQISDLMSYFRNEAFDEIAGDKVLSRIDLKEGTRGLPKTNMLIYRLEGGRSFMLRPSGTEPKVKCYIFAKSSIKDLGAARNEAQEIISKYEKFFDEKLSLVTG